MSAVISPTPGRIVWYYPAANDNLPRIGAQPLAALVAGVFSDRYINLAVFDANGDVQRRSSVYLVQPGDEARPTDGYATWMPYQISAAGIAPQASAPAPVPESDPNSEGSTTD